MRMLPLPKNFPSQRVSYEGQGGPQDLLRLVLVNLLQKHVGNGRLMPFSRPLQKGPNVGLHLDGGAQLRAKVTPHAASRAEFALY